MKENENKALIAINENSIFYKIKSFFKKFLAKDKNIIQKQNIVDFTSSEIKEDKQKENFIKSIRIDERMNLLELQSKLKRGIIRIENLSEETKLKLIDLYEEQNSEKKNKLKVIKNKILIIRDRLQTS